MFVRNAILGRQLDMPVLDTANTSIYRGELTNRLNKIHFPLSRNTKLPPDIKLNNFKVIHRNTGKSNFSRKILEALAIKNEKPTLNHQINLDLLLF